MTAAILDAPDVVTRAVAGDAAAFTELYREHHGVIFRFVWRRVGNRTLAEDLTADVFVRVLRHVGNFEWQGIDIKAWLFTIARNIVADYFGSGRYRFEIASSTTHDHARQADDMEARPEETVTDHVTNISMLRCLHSLCTPQRDVLAYRFLLGLTLAETAAAMGKTTTAVKELQHRATTAAARHLPELPDRAIHRQNRS